MRHVFLFLLIFFSSGSLWAEPGYREVLAGNKAFQASNFPDAIARYEEAARKNPRQALIDYDQGTAFYKNGEYDKAVEAFQKGLLTENKKVLKDVQYNLGNAFYMAGIAKEDADIGAAIKSLESALPYYEKVLAVDVKDADARSNYDFVAQEIKRLKEKQQQQSQSKTCPNPKKGQGDAGDQGQASSSGEQQSSSSQEQEGARQEAPPDGDQSPPQGEKDNRSTGSGDEKAPESSSSEGRSLDGEKKPGSPAGQALSGQISSEKEARMLLDDFDQNEQPKGLMNFIRKSGQERPVVKDW